MTPLGPTATGFAFLFGLPVPFGVAILAIEGHYWSAVLVGVGGMAFVAPFIKDSIEEFRAARRYQQENDPN